MIRAAIKRRDGLPSGRIWLHSVVRNVQLALIDSGHLKVVSEVSETADGRFGPGTEQAVTAFQSDANLEPKGVVDRASWSRLEPHLQNAIGEREARTAELLSGFRGDLDWIHAKEAHKGRPYWPAAESGVTLDPGVDLGHADPELIERLYEPLLTAAQMEAVRQVFGIQGEAARDALKASSVLAGIRFSKPQAAEIMPLAAQSYWKDISDRFKILGRKAAPPSVQTALLSLAYNRGAQNHHLEVLGAILENQQWADAASKIAAMQQNHELEGIRTRRREEGELIRAELEFLAS